MRITKEKINFILNSKNLTKYKVCRLIDCADSTLSEMINGISPFSESVIVKLLPILEVSREEFDSWVIADKYPESLIKQAFDIKKTTKVKRKQLILTLKIDAILEVKDISRTILAKQIKYSQSGLNRMIIGEIGVSKSVLERLTKALEVSQDELSSWILADKYSLKTFEMALKEKKQPNSNKPKAKKSKKKIVGLDIDKAEYQEIVLSNSNFPYKDF